MIIVTGAAGFIGSNMIAELSSTGNQSIVACDYWGSGKKWMNVSKHFIADFVHPDQLLQYIRQEKRIHAVLHLGAISATSELNVDSLIETNIRLTIDLWDLCTELNIVFFYASSAATYGSLEADLVDDQSPEALAKLRPLNGYGWSKHSVDQILMQRVSNGMSAPPQWCGLKFFNVYGPNEYHKDDMQSVVSKFFVDVRESRPIRLFKSHRIGIADGGQCRDFVYVKDCTAVMRWLLDHSHISGLFNIGTGEARSFIDLIDSIGIALDLPVQYNFVPMPEHLRDRYQYFTQANISKLRSAGYTASFYSVEHGVADYVLNYLDASDRYR